MKACKAFWSWICFWSWVWFWRIWGRVSTWEVSFTDDNLVVCHVPTLKLMRQARQNLQIVMACTGCYEQAKRLAALVANWPLKYKMRCCIFHVPIPCRIGENHLITCNDIARWRIQEIRKTSQRFRTESCFIGMERVPVINTAILEKRGVTVTNELVYDIMDKEKI